MDEEVRFVVYDVTMREGTPPASDRVATTLGISADEAREAFTRLAEAHMLVLEDESHEILMAGPFSAVPTPFRVTTSKISCYANCVWDALGVPAMLHSDALIETSCADCETKAEIRVAGDEVHGDGFMHFVVPARLWWSHIVYT